jgi:cell division transport system permease protein
MASIPKNKPNYIYAVISVALVLFLLGVFALLALQGQQMIKMFKEQVEIIVELKEKMPVNAVDSITGVLNGSAYCKPNSVRFISREEGAAMMQKEFGEDFLKLDMPNPLYDVITFNVNAAYMQKDSMANIRNGLRQYSFVNDVFYQESVTDAIAGNLGKLSVWVLSSGLFFVIVAVALILNTIRLALYSNRFLIKNMELVGASWKFISRPYLIRSLKHGVISAMLTIGVLALIIYLIYKDAPDLQETLYLPGIGVIFAGLALLGILITVASTYFVVNKYLRMRVDDLY